MEAIGIRCKLAPCSRDPAPAPQACGGPERISREEPETARPEAEASERGERAMVEDPGTDLGLGPIEQVAYVVEDMDRAVEYYSALFGPFQVSDQKMEGCTYRGRDADISLRMAVNHSSPVEIELLQPVEGQSPLTEHLEKSGEGLHHVRFRTDGIDAKLEELGARGFETLLYKRFGPGVAFAYIETPSEYGGIIIELLELP